MSNSLRHAYDAIAEDYLKKKKGIWLDFREYLGSKRQTSSCIDVGCGNGRNLNAFNASLCVGIDISMQLLRGFIGPIDSQRIQGALPSLPIRKKASKTTLVIAVIHHIETKDLQLSALKEVSRISMNTIHLSVWRKWRKGVREKIFQAIKQGINPTHLYNVNRPWKDSKGVLLTTRFYHYFTFREIRELANLTGLIIHRNEIRGGKHKDANFFCTLLKSS